MNHVGSTKELTCAETNQNYLVHLTIRCFWAHLRAFLGVALVNPLVM